MRGQVRHRPEFEVVVPRDKDLIRDTRPPLRQRIDRHLQSQTQSYHPLSLTRASRWRPLFEGCPDSTSGTGASIGSLPRQLFPGAQGRSPHYFSRKVSGRGNLRHTCKTTSAIAYKTADKRVMRRTLQEVAAGIVGIVCPKVMVTFARVELWTKLICQQHKVQVKYSNHVAWSFHMQM